MAKDRVRGDSLNVAFKRYATKKSRRPLLGAAELTPGQYGGGQPPFEDTEAVQTWMREMVPAWKEWWMSDQAIARGYTDKQNQLVFDELARVIETPEDPAFKHLYNNAFGNVCWGMAHWDHLPTEWVEPIAFNDNWTLEDGMRRAAYQLPWKYYPYGYDQGPDRVVRVKELEAKLQALVAEPGTPDYDALANALQSGTALEWLRTWLGE